MIIPRTKWAINAATSPFRLNQAQRSAGSKPPVPSAWFFLAFTSMLPEAENTIPWVTQYDGIIQNTHLKISPTYWVCGINWRVYTVSDMIPPAIKCINRVHIWATVSEEKMKEVTYEKGTTAIGNSTKSTHTPSYQTLERYDISKIARIGIYAFTRSAKMFAAQYPNRLIPEINCMCLSCISLS